MKTNDLREAVRNILLPLQTTYSLDGIYYKLAKDSALYPHIVFDFISERSTSEGKRYDYTIDIDVYGKSEEIVLNIADSVEALFNNVNDPKTAIYPTFFLSGRHDVEDSDKSIRHTLVRIDAQLYET